MIESPRRIEPLQPADRAQGTRLVIQIPCLNERDQLPRTFADLPRTVRGVDQIEVLIVPGSAYAADTPEGIRRAFASAFGAGMHIRVTPVDAIPPDPSGKLRFFLSKVPVVG